LKLRVSGIIPGDWGKVGTRLIGPAPLKASERTTAEAEFTGGSGVFARVISE